MPTAVQALRTSSCMSLVAAPGAVECSIVRASGWPSGRSRMPSAPFFRPRPSSRSFAFFGSYSVQRDSISLSYSGEPGIGEYWRGFRSPLKTTSAISLRLIATLSASRNCGFANSSRRTGSGAFWFGK